MSARCYLRTASTLPEALRHLRATCSFHRVPAIGERVSVLARGGGYNAFRVVDVLHASPADVIDGERIDAKLDIIRIDPNAQGALA